MHTPQVAGRTQPAAGKFCCCCNVRGLKKRITSKICIMSCFAELNSVPLNLLCCFLTLSVCFIFCLTAVKIKQKPFHVILTNFDKSRYADQHMYYTEKYIQGKYRKIKLKMKYFAFREFMTRFVSHTGRRSLLWHLTLMQWIFKVDLCLRPV